MEQKTRQPKSPMYCLHHNTKYIIYIYNTSKLAGLILIAHPLRLHPYFAVHVRHHHHHPIIIASRYKAKQRKTSYILSRWAIKNNMHTHYTMWAVWNRTPIAHCEKGITKSLIIKYCSSWTICVFHLGYVCIYPNCQSSHDTESRQYTKRTMLWDLYIWYIIMLWRCTRSARWSFKVEKWMLNGASYIYTYLSVSAL